MKLIVASVRLPISLTHDDGGWNATPSPGGLATALRAVAERRPFTWIGFPGTPVPNEAHDDVRATLAEHGSVPVFLTAEEVEGFYEELSNRVLWPLFHGLPGMRRFPHAAWRTYRAINERFAEVVAAHAEPGDTVWIHDYQLMLVPQLLRDRGIDCAIGFFLHIPFPSSEIYRTLPVREAILTGMLGADYLGFHSYEYVNNLRNAGLRVLGLESDPEGVVLPPHYAQLGVLPIGIEPDEIASLATSEEAVAQYAELRERYRGKRVILGVDRLDHTKGIPQRLLAFEELLRDHPELRDEVVLVQIASPSRTNVPEYQDLAQECNELVGHINGKYGTLASTPLHYLNQHVDRARLTALYRLAEIALVTPVRDGMNLVCLEYVAARGDVPGVLILSEFAGAASCLPGARVVNPHNPAQVATAMADALRDGPSRTAWAQMRDFVTTNTSVAWAEKFLARLEAVYQRERGRLHTLRVGHGDAVDRLVEDARLPLVLLDYDGTLVPHTRLPSDAVPGHRVRELLADLARFGVVYVISGRPADTLDEWIGDLPIGLVCEHGLATRHLGGGWSELPDLDTSAIADIVEPILRDYTDRTPGSKLERKRASIAWHYRTVDPKLGAWRANELRFLLDSALVGQPFAVLSGSKVVEVRHVSITKGHTAERLLARQSGTDLVVCCGNDRTDEDMFEAVLSSDRDRRLVCRVGGGNTVAPYVVEDPAQLLDQLDQMVAIWRRLRTEDPGRLGRTLPPDPPVNRS
ncbi:MAG: bifunctional alpha,alpha-trehalose-phosphate synthase (UDP-forming)/trehalose-phosphatase [Myxococcota bacterium]